MIKIGMMAADRYEILEKIGTGGMSDVYKAKDHKLNRFVAVKVLKQEFSENGNFVSKFRTEAQAAAGMMHPNIVNVYDVGEEGGVHYIVMELVEGITLKKYIEKKNRLTIKEAVSIAIQVSMGIECAHNNHIIHRDIKPQNIMISRDGKVKVTDFGIAKAVSSNTITSNVMGSVHYTSPEQARGGYSDEKSDIYSLGITMFEMLTGRVPFNGETTVAIAIKHIQDTMPSPKEFVSEIPISVEQIVMKCTQKSPDKRYQNMAELIEDLKKSLMNPDEDFVKMVDTDVEQATRMRMVDGGSLASGEAIMRRADDEYDRYGNDYEGDEYYDGEEYADEYYEDEYDDSYSDEYDEYPEDYQDDYYDDEYIDNRSGLSAINPYIAASGKGSSKKPKKSNKKPAPKKSAPKKNTKKPTKPVNKKSAKDGRNKAKGDDKGDKLTTVLTIIGGFLCAIVALLIIYFLIFGSDNEKPNAEPTPGVEEAAPTPEAELGENETLVMSVQGMSYAEAVATLEKEGFKTEKIEVPHESIPKGSIVDQIPAAGTAAERGTTVKLSVSTGPSTEKRQVPNVIGLEIADAVAVLVESGFNVGDISETINPDESLTDKVCYQSYSPGTSIDAGSTLDLKISKGPGKTTYSYIDNIESPGIEDPDFVAGTQAIVIVTTATGVELRKETTSNFPIAVNISGITDSDGGLITFLYTIKTPATTTTNEAGETIETPETSEDRSVTRAIKFTKE